MATKKPIILAIDDEPEVINAVLRDLRNKYGKSYRIVKATVEKKLLKSPKISNLEAILLPYLFQISECQELMVQNSLNMH